MITFKFYYIYIAAFAIAICLIIAGFLVPPLGIIDGSVLLACGEIITGILVLMTPEIITSIKRETEDEPEEQEETINKSSMD